MYLQVMKELSILWAPPIASSRNILQLCASQFTRCFEMKVYNTFIRSPTKRYWTTTPNYRYYNSIIPWWVNNIAHNETGFLYLNKRYPFKCHSITHIYTQTTNLKGQIVCQKFVGQNVTGLLGVFIAQREIHTSSYFSCDNACSISVVL